MSSPEPGPRRPRRRPPWWPEDEPWPPRGRPPWAGHRRRHRPPWPFFLLFPVLTFALLVMAVATAVAGPGVLRWAAVVAVAAMAISLALAALAAWRISSLIRGRARAGERRRREFLADVAHELRTPLAVIRAQAEAITDGVYPGDAEHLAPVLDATRTLERLVDDLRNLSLADAGALEPNLEQVDAAELLGDTVAAHKAAAAEAGLTLLVEGQPVRLRADPQKLRSVLDNLVTNAIRHTPAGGLVRLGAREEQGLSVIEVADTGGGIPAELLPRLFDRFTKGPGSNGSGLGLAISREVVRAHGGDIEVESEPGRTVFRVRLPG